MTASNFLPTRTAGRRVVSVGGPGIPVGAEGSVSSPGMEKRLNYPENINVTYEFQSAKGTGIRIVLKVRDSKPSLRTICLRTLTTFTLGRHRRVSQLHVYPSSESPAEKLALHSD